MIGSGVVWARGAVKAPSTPVVPTLIASAPISVQSWRVKLATLDFPLVPVTATCTSGWASNQSAAQNARASRGSSTTTTGTFEPSSTSAAKAAPSRSVRMAPAFIRKAY